MGDKDYYKVLGLARGASPADIRRAYHRLAKESHPDASNASDSGQRFREIAEAYEVLGDAQARWEYDRRTAPASDSKPHVENEARGDQNQQNPAGVRGVSPGQLAASQFTPASTAEPGCKVVAGWRKRGRGRRRREKVKLVLGLAMFTVVGTGAFLFLPCYVMPIGVMLAAALFIPRHRD